MEVKRGGPWQSDGGSAAEGGSVSCSCVVSSVRGSWARRVWRQWPLLYIVRQRLSDGGQGRYRVKFRDSGKAREKHSCDWVRGAFGVRPLRGAMTLQVLRNKATRSVALQALRAVRLRLCRPCQSLRARSTISTGSERRCSDSFNPSCSRTAAISAFGLGSASPFNSCSDIFHFRPDSPLDTRVLSRSVRAVVGRAPAIKAVALSGRRAG